MTYLSRLALVLLIALASCKTNNTRPANSFYSIDTTSIDTLIAQIEASVDNDQYDQTIELSNRAISSIEALPKNQSLLAKCFFYKAQAISLKHTKKGVVSLDTAYECISKAIAFKTALHGPEWQVGNYTRLKADILANYIREDSLESAITYFERAKKQLEPAKKLRPDLQIKLLTNWGYAYFQNHQTENAKKNLRESVKFYNSLVDSLKKEKENEDAYFRTLNNLGECYFIDKKYDTANIYYNKALNVKFEKLKNNTWPDKQNINNLDSLSLEYISTLFSDITQNFLAWSKSDTTQKKAYLKKAIQAARLSDTVLDKMRSLHNNTTSKYFWRFVAKRLYDNALECCLLLNDTETAFYFIEKSRAVILMEYLTTQEKKQEKNESVSLDSINTKLIQNHQTLISYFVGDSSVYAYVTGGSNTFKKLSIKPEQLMNWVKRYQVSCAKKDEYKWYHQLYVWVKNWFGEYNYLEESYELYKALVEPLGTLEPNVLISFDEGTIPFEGFLTKNELNASYFLINHYNFSYTYSASYWYQALQKPLVSSDTSLVIAPMFYKTLGPLTKGDSLTAALGRLGYKVSLIEAKYATKNVVLDSLQNRNHSTIYFYTHATAQNTSALYLYKPSTLSMADFTNNGLKIRANLVFLAACETAQGINARGEGVLSIARGFAYTGVLSTIAAGWSIPENASLKIAQEFAKHQKHTTNTAALAQAKRTYLRAHPDDFMPFHWAGLVLIGR